MPGPCYYLEPSLRCNCPGGCRRAYRDRRYGQLLTLAAVQQEKRPGPRDDPRRVRSRFYQLFKFFWFAFVQIDALLFAHAQSMGPLFNGNEPQKIGPVISGILRHNKPRRIPQ
jgi:hypothetical protein